MRLWSTALINVDALLLSLQIMGLVCGLSLIWESVLDHTCDKLCRSNHLTSTFDEGDNGASSTMKSQALGIIIMLIIQVVC